MALVFHVGLILALGHYRHPTLWENGMIAAYLDAGKGFSGDFSIPGEATSWQAPGYPYLLVAAWKLLGHGVLSYLAISLLQAVAVSSIVFPVGWMTRRWFGAEAAVLSRWLVCAMPLYAWYATRLHHTAFVMALHPWLLWGWLSLAEKPGCGKALSVGIGSGVGALFQPLILVLLGPVALWKLGGGLIGRNGSRAVCLLLAGMATVLALTPWTIRNGRVHHRLVFVKDSFGKEFWLGNNPHATGTAFVEGGAGEITNVYPPRAMQWRGTMPEADLMKAMQNEAVDYCRAEPKAFVLRTVKKIVWFWTMTPARFERSVVGGEALSFRWVQGLYWGVFLGLGGVAFLAVRPWPREYGGVLLLAVVFYSVVYGLIHVGQARFRGEIEYLFLPAVAAGLRWAWSRWRSSSGLSSCRETPRM